MQKFAGTYSYNRTWYLVSIDLPQGKGSGGIFREHGEQISSCGSSASKNRVGWIFRGGRVISRGHRGTRANLVLDSGSLMSYHAHVEKCARPILFGLNPLQFQAARSAGKSFAISKSLRSASNSFRMRASGNTQGAWRVPQNQKQIQAKDYGL